MLFARILTGLTASIWIGYGLWLIWDPTQLSYIGLEFTHWSVTTEVFAMYGFAELCLGIFALLGVLAPRRYLHANLTLWFLIFTGLWVGRVIGIARFGGYYGVAFGDLPGSYNSGTTYLYELPFSVMYAIALWRTRNHPDLA
jgi:hypothetical protein